MVETLSCPIRLEPRPHFFASKCSWRNVISSYFVSILFCVFAWKLGLCKMKWSHVLSQKALPPLVRNNSTGPDVGRATQQRNAGLHICSIAKGTPRKPDQAPAFPLATVSQPRVTVQSSLAKRSQVFKKMLRPSVKTSWNVWTHFYLLFLLLIKKWVPTVLYSQLCPIWTVFKLVCNQIANFTKGVYSAEALQGPLYKYIFFEEMHWCVKWIKKYQSENREICDDLQDVHYEKSSFVVH